MIFIRWLFILSNSTEVGITMPSFDWTDYMILQTRTESISSEIIFGFKAFYKQSSIENFSQNQKGFGCIVAAVIMVYLCYFLNHTAFFNEMI